MLGCFARRGGARLGMRGRASKLANGPPSLLSLSFSQFDVLGGGLDIVGTGTGLGGATSVTVGGTPATITGNTPTSITFTVPAKAGGIYDVIVTTPSGPTTLANSLEAWAPTVETGCVLFCVPGGYVATAGNGTWTPRVGTSPTQATLAPPAVGGVPVFNGTTHRLDCATINTLATLSPTEQISFSAIIEPTSLVAPAGSPINDPALWTTTRSSLGGRITTNGFGPLFYDGSYHSADVPLTAAPHAVASRLLIPNDSIQGSVDGSAFATNSLATGTFMTGDSTEVVYLGTNYAGLVHYAGKIHALAFHNAKVPDTYALKWYKWGQQMGLVS